MVVRNLLPTAGATAEYGYLAKDIKQQMPTGEPPSETQLRWAIHEMRQDLSLLTVTNFATLLVLVYALVLKF